MSTVSISHKVRFLRALATLVAVGAASCASDDNGADQSVEAITGAPPYVGVVDVTTKTGRTIAGTPVVWQKQTSTANVENVVARDASSRLVHFSWTPATDWVASDLSTSNGVTAASDPTGWRTTSWLFGTQEHLAVRTTANRVVALDRSLAGTWGTVDVTSATNVYSAGAPASWVAAGVEHIAVRDASGVLYDLARSSGLWTSTVIGTAVLDDPTAWTTTVNGTTSQHVAARGTDGRLYTFMRTTGAWSRIDATTQSGASVVGPLAAWSTGTVEHLAGATTAGRLVVLYRSPNTSGWRSVDVTTYTGETVTGMPAVYQMQDGTENVEILGARSTSGQLLYFWWKPSLDWQCLSVTDLSARSIAGSPAGWVTPNLSEHHAARDPNGRLLVFYSHTQPRLLTDAVQQPTHGISRVRARRRLVTILWDPHRPEHPAPTRETVRQSLFGATNSMRDYFLVNSSGYFTVDEVATFGWFDADKPADHYWNHPADANDGFASGHVEKWTEAIRKADLSFNFAAYDDNRDGVLQPSELGVLIVIPQNGPFGTNRTPYARELPTAQPLVVDGVRIPTIAEVYAGSPVNFPVVAHELSHLFLGLPDMYWTGFTHTAAGDYSLMDRSYDQTHIDPLAKLKLGWLRPRVMLRSGTFPLANIEDSARAWVLVDPRRGTDEYFLVENRLRAARYESQMNDDGGLAVWHVMENDATWQAMAAPPNVDATLWAASAGFGRRGILMVRPIMTPPFNDANALWDGAQAGTNYNLLSVDSDPTHNRLTWASGAASGFALQRISGAGATMSATITAP